MIGNRRICLVIVLLLVGVPRTLAFARKWADSTGKYATEAEFVDFKDGKVQLEKDNGNIVSIPLEKLCEADQKFVREVVSQQPRKDDSEPQIPTKPAKPAAAVTNSGPPPYVDKNKHFEFSPPPGWIKKEFADPRTKVSFDLPSAIPGQNKAGLFFLSHPLSGDVSARTEAEDRVARLKQMGSSDAKVTTVDFAGVKAEQVEGEMGRQNIRLRVLMFTKHRRSYVISFTATKQDYAQYWPVAEAALKTFKCIPPSGAEVTSEAEQDRIQKEKIRVWITALKEPDLSTDAFNSLLAVGQPAIPQLEEAVQLGTALQKQRAVELLKRIRGGQAK